jgi:hypothetical protein
MITRTLHKLRWPLLGGCSAALVLAATSGATHLGSLQLGHLNTSTEQTTLTASLPSPVLKVVNNGTAAAVRGEAQNGIGTNGISASGVGQQGASQSGTGTLGTHSDTTGAKPGVEGITNSTDAAGAGVLGRNNGGGPGLRAIVNAGAPPLAVNSDVKVTNLNSDLLDGLNGPDLQKRVTGSCAAGSAIRIVNENGSVSCETLGGADAGWSLTGNAGTTAGTNFLGTTDNQALELKVNGARALRLEPPATSPNLIGGFAGNAVLAFAVGATIAGGGLPSAPNLVNDSLGTIGGGEGNVAGDQNNPGNSASATVAGGADNTASGPLSAVGGGLSNSASGYGSVVPGGDGNTASGYGSVVSGGVGNTASGDRSVVAGGSNNTASGGTSVIAGGQGNTASGTLSAVPGGQFNEATGAGSFAAGFRAKANHQGAFVWADSADADFASTAPDQFLVRAAGGVGIGTNAPSRQLDVNGVVGVFDGTRNRNGGVATEAGSTVIDFGMNDDALNRFGGAYTQADQGGFLRVDTRTGQPLFNFMGRSAGDAAGVFRLGYINSAGTVRYEVGTGQKFSLGGNGSFEIDAPGVVGGRFIFGQNGRVGIGVPNPGWQLQLSQDSAAKPGSNTWTVPSDRRLKKDVRPFTDGLSTLAQIDPVRYVLNGRGGMPENKRGIGVIAQDVKDVVPYTISTFNAKLDPGDAKPTELYSFDSSALTFVTINAVKQLAKQNASLRRQLASLRERDRRLEARVAEIEKRIG